jgi:hypothetical protein
MERELERGRESEREEERGRVVEGEEGFGFGGKILPPTRTR